MTENYERPQEDPNGRWLLVFLNDAMADDGPSFSRWATKDTAVMIAANYTGASGARLFEITSEIDLDGELELFWKTIAREHEEALEDAVKGG